LDKVHISTPFSKRVQFLITSIYIYAETFQIKDANILLNELHVILLVHVFINIFFYDFNIKGSSLHIL